MSTPNKGKRTRDLRSAPPVSLETKWDKASWHRDAESFPKHLPPEAARAHILATLRFLDEQGMLTAEGRSELADTLGEDTALLDVHVRAPARAFLDHAYTAYCERTEYGKEPPVEVLRAAWKEYQSRYDLAKRPQPNPWQAVLLKWGRKLDTLLRRMQWQPEIAEALRRAAASVPEEDRPLVEAVLRLREEQNPENWAARHPHPQVLLEALRYVDGVVSARTSLKLACMLAGRLDAARKGSPYLAAVAWAVNLGTTKADLNRTGKELRSLTPGERDLLARAVNLLYQHGPDVHLAICAMRSVGDARSLKLLKAHVHGPREGTTQVGGGPERPGWLEVKNEAIAAIEGRLHTS